MPGPYVVRSVYRAHDPHATSTLDLSDARLYAAHRAAQGDRVIIRDASGDIVGTGRECYSMLAARELDSPPTPTA